MIWKSYENVSKHDMLDVMKQLKKEYKGLRYICFSGSYAHMVSSEVKLSIEFDKTINKIYVYGHKLPREDANLVYKRFFTDYKNGIISFMTK